MMSQLVRFGHFYFSFLPFDSVTLASGSLTLAFTDSRGYGVVNTQGGYPVWFVFGEV